MFWHYASCLMLPVPWHLMDLTHVIGDFVLKPSVNMIESNGMPNADNSLPPSGQSLLRAFELLVATLNERKIRYAIIGGLAVIQHTRVRTTDDIDALITVPQIGMAALFESLAASGFDVELTKNIRELRDDGLTTIQYEDVIVDLMRPVIPAYAHVLDRAFEAQILGHAVRVSSAESLIVMKVIAFRPRHGNEISMISFQFNLE